MEKMQQDLAIVREKILQEIFDQCKFGSQSRALGEQAAACGQFIGKEAREISQRGIFGTAAALRVLAHARNEESRELVGNILYYLKNRSDIECKLTPEDSPVAEKLQRDEGNVIKVSELLYAVSCVPRDTADTSELQKTLGERLLEGVREDKGWANFISQDNLPIEPLPTAYAVRGLKAAGYSDSAISGPINFLKESLQNDSLHGCPVDSSVEIFIIFVLSELSYESREERKRLKRSLLQVRRIAEPLLSYDIEQNIEYWSNDRSFYVRVPWQLYYIGAAARLSPRRLLASKNIAMRLRTVIRESGGDGFRYPHSGRMLSTRTSSILFDILMVVEPALTPTLRPFIVVDRLRVLLSHRFFSYAGIVVAFVVALASVWKWNSGGGSLADLAPEFVGALFIFLFSLRRGH